MDFTNILLTLGAEGTFWLPERAARGAAENVDTSFYFIYWVSVFFFIVVIGAMIALAIRYHRSREPKPQDSPAHNTKLELAWSILPSFLLVIMFYLGFVGYMDARIPPENSYEISVTAQMWTWSFKYPTGHEDTELHVPVDTNIRMVMGSNDVIHSFFVPAFRVKMDVVPGRFTKTWFNATTIGTYDLKCAEYCGRNHSLMRTKVIVHEKEEFQNSK